MSTLSASQFQLLLTNVGLQAERLLNGDEPVLSPTEQDLGVLVFSIDPLLLKAVSDRGQVFVDVASRRAHGEWFQFCDVEVALGLSTTLAVMEMDEPEPLVEIVRTLAKHFDAVCALFDSDELGNVDARLLAARAGRRAAMESRLR